MGGCVGGEVVLEVRVVGVVLEVRVVEVVLEVRVVEGCVGGEGCGGLCWR